jgi:hypothetical protein
MDRIRKLERPAVQDRFSIRAVHNTVTVRIRSLVEGFHTLQIAFEGADESDIRNVDPPVAIEIDPLK